MSRSDEIARNGTGGQAILALYKLIGKKFTISDLLGQLEASR